MNCQLLMASLSSPLGRRTGSLPSFTRYQSLDAFLTDPRHDIPGNRMTFPGIKDQQARHDSPSSLDCYNLVHRSRSALPTTLTELSAIAAAAMIGLSVHPNTG